MTAPAPTYIGRFAPSPTGPLHLGSLACAVASCLEARSRHGRWLLRMEDLDPPREVAGAAGAIMRSLEAHGLHWDGAALWQSARLAAYREAIDQLLAAGRAFHCNCSRAQLAARGGVHRGHCRRRPPPGAADCAVRLRLQGDTHIAIADQLQPPLRQDLAATVGDFVIRRRDGLHAYQLAVVVDDAFQGITHVLRGSDLYDSTPRQAYLQQALGLPRPAYCHVPVLTNAAGQKLSKQTHAPALDDRRALDNLRLALRLLRQPPPDAGHSQPDTLLREAAANWRLERVPRRAAMAAASHAWGRQASGQGSTGRSSLASPANSSASAPGGESCLPVW